MKGISIGRARKRANLKWYFSGDNVHLSRGRNKEGSAELNVFRFYLKKAPKFI